MSKHQRSDWKSSLQEIGAKLPKGNPGTPASGGAGKIPAGAISSPNLSTEVQSKERAGRAPYNFVPVPEKVRLDAEAAPPPADRYHADLLSGEIDLRIEALTDFYVRGMWTYKDYQEKSVNGEPVQVKDQAEPFGVGSALRLPGSSLRGMVRTLVEILSDAPLDPINDSQLFFRAVGASNQPKDKAFEPHAVIYKERMVIGSGSSKKDPIGPKAQVGYLHASKDGWKIRPALKHPTHGTQWYRVDRQNLGSKWEGLYKIWFKPVPPGSGTYPHRNYVHYKFGTVTDFTDRNGGAAPAGYEPGWLICSGYIKGKYLQWIVHEEDTVASFRDVPDYDTAAYKESGISYWLSKEKPQLAYKENVEAKPCFYVEWKDAEGNLHVSFGHTPYFRLPYKTTPRTANPAPRTDKPGWSLAEAVFGRVKPGEPAKTRVFVEDGILIDGPTNPVAGGITTTVLGAPKPTTYQHYLVQKSEAKADSIHWDDPKARLRGHKLYWHRPGVTVKEAGPKQKKVATSFRPAKTGAVFQARIRYENLRPEELGALLTALELPEGCAHKLGMGKPLGLGSFRISLAEMREINRHDRYAAFCDAGLGQLVTGVTPPTPERRRELKNAFAAWQTGGNSDKEWERLWEQPRFAELKALLTYDGLPKDQDRWNNMTRYLEFGKRKVAGDEFDYNEYTHVDHAIGVWPPPVTYGKRKPSNLQPRRPLPPATQVLREAGKEKPNLPADEPPPFAEREEESHDRRTGSVHRRGGPRQRR